MFNTLSRRCLESESYLVRNDRVSSSENSPHNRRTKSNFPSSATKGDFTWGEGRVVSAIARGWQWPVRVTTILPCRLVTAIPSLPPPKPPPYAALPTRENVYGERATCALCVEKMWEACVCMYNAFGSTAMWGSGAHFLFVFFHLQFLSIDNQWTLWQSFY